MGSVTPRLALSQLQQAQSQKHVTVNDDLIAIDALIDLYLLGQFVNTPPSSPVDGDSYVVGGVPTGAWVGYAYKVAYCMDGAWRFFAPFNGLRAYLASNGASLVYVNGVWLGDMLLPGKLGVGGAIPDSNNPVSMNISSMLLSNGSGTLNVTLSKQASANDARFTFQTNFSTRALFGLLGDDNFTVKTSPDGSTFKIGFVVSKDTGAVDHTQGAKFEAVTNYDNYVAANIWTKVAFNSANHNDQNAFNGTNNRFVAPIAGYYLVGMKWRFKANSTVPASIQGALYKNGAALAQTAVESWGTVVTLRTRVETQTVLKLAANDYIEVFAFMETNDGYVASADSVFYGARIA